MYSDYSLLGVIEKEIVILMHYNIHMSICVELWTYVVLKFDNLFSGIRRASAPPSLSISLSNPKKLKGHDKLAPRAHATAPGTAEYGKNPPQHDASCRVLITELIETTALKFVFLVHVNKVKVFWWIE